MDSEKTKYWTIAKAQGAVKASFFSRGFLVSKGVGEVWLRFTEIKQIIAATEGPVGDRTLSRALAGLVGQNRLKKKIEGKFSLYSLVIPWPERVRAFARAEAAAVEGAGSIGGMGDSTEGWAVYGIPDIIPKSYRRRFKKECFRHQEVLREVLYDIWEKCFDAILKPVRKRVSRKIFRDGEKALEYVMEFQMVGSSGLGYAARFWGVVEGTIPGAQRAFQLGAGLTFAPEATFPERVSAIVSWTASRPIEEVRSEVNKEFARLQNRIQKAGLSFKVLWDNLTPREKARAERILQAATVMTACLTSVVHA